MAKVVVLELEDDVEIVEVTQHLQRIFMAQPPARRKVAMIHLGIEAVADRVLEVFRSDRAGIADLPAAGDHQAD